MNKWIITIAVIFGLTQAAFAQDAKVVNGIAAVVNEQVITQFDLNQQVAFFTKQLTASGVQLPSQEVLRKQVLQNMIDTQVQVQLADKTGIRVSNAQVTNAIVTMAKQQKLTTDELYQQIQAAGISPEEYREQVKNELLSHQLVQREVASRVRVTDEQVAQFKKSQMEQAHDNMSYQLGDILIAVPDSPTSKQIQDAKQKAEALLRQIQSGEKSFKNAAVTMSDSSSALKGGDLGLRKFSDLPSIFADEVVNMKEGDVVGPLRAGNGFHLIKLMAIKQDDSAKPLTDEQIRQALFNQKLMNAMQDWLSKNKAQSYIKIY